jgi:hypothetical protein
MTSGLRVRATTLATLGFGRSPCDGALLPNGIVACGRGFVQALGTTRLQSSIQSRHGISDDAGSLISPRLQPARYVLAMEFPRPVMRTLVLPLETPAACRVRLAATTLQLCEILAERRIRLSLPYLRRALLLGATGTSTQPAKRSSSESWPISCRPIT